MNTSRIFAAWLVTAFAASFPLTAAVAVECPIKIGGVAPLSAPGAVGAGEGMRAAMLLAEIDINKAGGVLGCDIKVVIGDSEGLPEKAKALMEKLITQEGVVAVGGGYHSSVGVGSKDVANDMGIPVVFAETWNDTITGDKQKYIFRIAPLSSWASASHAVRMGLMAASRPFSRDRPAASARARILSALRSLDSLISILSRGGAETLWNDGTRDLPQPHRGISRLASATLTFAQPYIMERPGVRGGISFGIPFMSSRRCSGRDLPPRRISRTWRLRTRIGAAGGDASP